jgi:hydrogenase nickel incorporation protein HypB
MKTTVVMESVYARNEKLAAELNRSLTARGVFCVNVLGAPGVGKTTSLIQILQRLGRPGCVIEGDIASDIDAEKLRGLGFPAVQINTGGACHLDAPIVADALDGLDFSDGFMFIENIGNLVCPVGYLLGEHIKLLITAVTDGSDKPYKYPAAFEKADVILLNKADLLAHVDFDEGYFMEGIRKLNPGVPVFEVSWRTGAGYDEVAAWLRARAA